MDLVDILWVGVGLVAFALFYVLVKKYFGSNAIPRIGGGGGGGIDKPNPPKEKSKAPSRRRRKPSTKRRSTRKPKAEK